MTSKKHTERRKEKRYDASGAAVFSETETTRWANANLRNVSARGANLELDIGLFPGTRLYLKVDEATPPAIGALEAGRPVSVEVKWCMLKKFTAEKNYIAGLEIRKHA